MKKKKSVISNKVWLLISFLAAMLVWYLLSLGKATGRSFPFADKVVPSVKTMIDRGAFFKDIASSMSCVGAGFAVFESAGYAFQCLLSTGADSAMMDITLLRGVLAVGGHVVWTAIAGAALAAAKGEEMFNIQQLISGRFLFFFAISVILHGVWDCPLQFLGAYGKYIVLIVLAWVVTVTLISSGLTQITRLAQQKGNENQ